MTENIDQVRELEAEIDRANLRADRRAADLRVKNRRVRELEADNQRLRALADRRWLAWKSARLRAANSRIAAQVLWGQIAHQDARETSLEDSQARILAIVNEWVDQADNGAADHGDLCDNLRAAGYTLPGADEETGR